MSKNRKILFGIFCALIALTVGFIWINSCFPQTLSSEESEAAHGTLQRILDAVFGENAIVVSSEAVRKIAHFTEFFALGAEISGLYFTLQFKTAKFYRLFFLLQFGLYVAVADETIQIFSERGPTVIDVLLDFSGYFIAALCCFAVFFAVRSVKNKKKPKINE